MMISSDSNPILIKIVVAKASLCAKLILKCFHYQSRNPKLLTKAFCVFVRPILEYASACDLEPHYKSQISKIEGVQRFFCKRLQGLWSHPYRSRLAQPGLDSLYCRRVKADLLVCYKILHNQVGLHLNCDDFFHARVLIVLEAIQ